MFSTTNVSNKWNIHGFGRMLSYEQYPEEKSCLWLSSFKKKLIKLNGGLLDVTLNIYLKSCIYHPDSECCTFFHGIWATRSPLKIHWYTFMSFETRWSRLIYTKVSSHRSIVINMYVITMAWRCISPWRIFLVWKWGSEPLTSSRCYHGNKSAATFKKGIFVHPSWVPNCMQNLKGGWKFSFPKMFDSYRDLFLRSLQVIAPLLHKSNILSPLHNK